MEEQFENALDRAVTQGWTRYDSNKRLAGVHCVVIRARDGTTLAVIARHIDRVQPIPSEEEQYAAIPKDIWALEDAGYEVISFFQTHYRGPN